MSEIEKNIIPVSVESRYVAVGDHVPIAAGNVGFDFVDITLDSEWTGLDIFVTFAGCAYKPTTVDFASELEVPYEQITDPCKLYIGVRGYETSSGVTIDEDNQIVENGAIPVLNTTAMRIPIYVQESGASGGAAPTQPTQDTLSRVQQDIIELEDAGKVLQENVGQVVATEQARVEAENARAASEKERASAEKTRISNENTRKADEETREANENTRKSNEQERISNENARKANESSRVSAEQLRVSAENERKEEFLRQLADWQAQVDATAIASLMSSVEFGVNDEGDLQCTLPGSPGYTFVLNENGDLEVVG